MGPRSTLSFGGLRPPSPRDKTRLATLRSASLASTLLGLALATSACGSDHDDGTGTGTDDFKTDGRGGTGLCDPLFAARAQQPMFSFSFCEPFGPEKMYVARELFGLWGTQPAHLCSYSPPGRQSLCGPQGPNNAFYCAPEDTISWDSVFLSTQDKQRTNFASVVVLAHEWGHLNQQRTGLLNPYRVPKQNELNADCQAGVFAAIEEHRGHLEPGDLVGAFKIFCDLGDPQWSWFDPKGHGTCQERTAWFGHGYQLAHYYVQNICGGYALQAMLSICAN